MATATVTATAMVMPTSQPVRAMKPSFFVQVPLLRSISVSMVMSPSKPYSFFQFPLLRSIPRREFKVEAKKKGQVQKLVSTAGTGFFYVKPISQKNSGLRKYDPRVRRHVMFTPTTIKSSVKKSRQKTKRKSRSER